jgi:uncharacterized protein YifN (PemK superfamily)
VAIPANMVLAVGQVVMCDFGPDPANVGAGGIRVGPLAVKPEIWKNRHSVIVSGRYGMATVVPMSTDVPSKIEKFHHKILAGKYDFLVADRDSWVKADLIESVSHRRLERPFLKGRYSGVFLDAADLDAVRKAVLHALKLGYLTEHI